MFVDRPHHIIDDVLDSLLPHSLCGQTHQNVAGLEVLFQVEKLFESLKEEDHVF